VLGDIPATTMDMQVVRNGTTRAVVASSFSIRLKEIPTTGDVTP